MYKDIRSEYMATHNSSGSNLEHGLDDSREVDMDGSDTSGGGSDGKGNITFPIIKVLQKFKSLCDSDYTDMCHIV